MGLDARMMVHEKPQSGLDRGVVEDEEEEAKVEKRGRRQSQGQSQSQSGGCTTCSCRVPLKPVI